MLQHITDSGHLRTVVQAARLEGHRVGLVPTMGALHAGHMSLVECARQECGLTIVTVFVNPTQFDPHEDLTRYPRDLDGDLTKLAEQGCDVVFTPSVEQMYPSGHDTTVDVGAVARPYEGEYRPNHFRGVATIVLKLFQIAPADCAYFGQKDYQQVLVVRQLVRDLNVPIEIRMCPTVREPDGLAMSSRNAYLSPEERRRAHVLPKSLQLVADRVAAGQRNVAELRQLMEERIAAEDVTLQYIAFVAEGTVEPVDAITGPTFVAIAAQVGNTRLIDNERIG